MTRTIIIAALLAAVAAPAVASDTTRAAIAHFNMSADTSADRIPVGPNGPVLGTTVSTRGNDALYEAVRNHNASADSAFDRIDVNTLTVFSGQPAHAADIFEELRLADETN
jgi:hypothetical protein